MNRQEWLLWRKQGIGASDVPVIMGVSPYSDIVKLYNEKISDDIEDKTNYIMELGNKLEPVARSKYEILNDADYPAVNFVHAEFSHYRASLDGYNKELNSAIEIKYVGKNFKDECPVKYFPQIQYQYAVSSCERIDLVQIDDMNNIKYFLVNKDQEYIKAMLERVDWFWACVVERKEEEINEVFASENLLKRKTKKPRGSVRNVLG